MKSIKILEEKENPLFKRKEIKAVVEADVTPSYRQVREEFSKKYSTTPDTIKINQVLSEFGKREFKISLNVYKTKKDLESIERKSKKEIKAEKEEAEAKAPKEAPAEEIKEEQKEGEN